ncbi:hypothetical protein ACJZ2D_011263 [Fusarium nematophilum]
MPAFQDSEGLQVDQARLKSPEMATQHPYDPNANHAPVEQKQQRPPFGLGLWNFAALIAVVTAVLVGGAVGGGLGAALANSQNSWNETTIAQDGTILYTPKPPSQVKNLTLECPEKGPKELNGVNGYQFDMWCGVDAVPGSLNQEDGEIWDIAAIIAYTIEDCMRACVELTHINTTQKNVKRCESLVFGPTLQDLMTSHGANCWLKDGKKKKGGNWEKEQTAYAYAKVKD